MKLNEMQMRQLVDEKMDLVKLLNKTNSDNHYEVGNSCFCPFHDNTDTPAAAIYDDENKISLWCWSEKKLYTASDAIEILLHRNVFRVADRLWSQMTATEQLQWLRDHEYTDYNELFSTNTLDDTEKPLDRELEKAKRLYKVGKLSVSKLVKSFIKSEEKLRG